MGRTLPTLTQQLTETEVALACFQCTLRRSYLYILDGLFAARAGIPLPSARPMHCLLFEAALLAMLLEQGKEIAVLHQKVDLLSGGSAYQVTD